MTNATLTGSDPNYDITVEGTTFDTAIAAVKNGTGKPLTLGLAGLDIDGKQVTVELKSTSDPNLGTGPNVFVALDDSIVSVEVFVGASFSVGGQVTGTSLGTFDVTPTYRQLEAEVTASQVIEQVGPDFLYLSTTGTVEITNSANSTDGLEVLAGGTVLTSPAISMGTSATLTIPAGTTSLTLQAQSSPSIQLSVPIYDTTQPTVTVTGSNFDDAQPSVITPSPTGDVVVVNEQTNSGIDVSWSGGNSATIAAWDQLRDPPSAPLDPNLATSTWYIQWEDTGDPDPKVVVKRLATTNGRRGRG